MACPPTVKNRRAPVARHQRSRWPSFHDGPGRHLSASPATPESWASAGDLLDLATRDDFHRWEHQLAATGNCANPIRLHGRIDAIDRATGEPATIYDTATEPGGVLLDRLRQPPRARLPGLLRQVYKNDARQIIRSGLTGGKGIPDTVAAHPCVFATLTAPGFGPVHTTRTGRARPPAGLPAPPRRHTSAAVRTAATSPAAAPTATTTRGSASRMCPDCYDYTGHVLFNALAPELWRRFTIYLPRQLARLAGITQKAAAPARSGSGSSRSPNTRPAASSTTTRSSASTPPATTTSHHPPGTPPQLLDQAIRQAAAAVSCDTAPPR